MYRSKWSVINIIVLIAMKGCIRSVGFEGRETMLRILLGAFVLFILIQSSSVVDGDKLFQLLVALAST